jgi:hypothetical protein
MKRILKSATAVLLLAAVVISVMTGAFAADVTAFDGKVYIDGPGGVTGYSVRNTAGSPAAANYTISDYISFVKTVQGQYLARDQYFTVRYNASLSALEAATDTLINDVLAYDDPATTSDLDYLEWNMGKGEYRWAIYTPLSGSYALFTFSQSYRTTAAQEDSVDTSVSAILDDLGIGTGSAYAKIKAVHDYIIGHVDYDDTLSRFTAYDALSSGLAVCQGYALLTYKMLMELGVPVRFICGTGNSGGTSGSHAWNIVGIGQLWYNLDTTWDDTAGTDAYFLRNNAAFSDHIREAEYKTDAFNAAYPMSPSDYKPDLMIQAVAFPQNGGAYNVGDTFTLQATITPASAADRTLSWSSSDPGVAAVDSTGSVTAVGPGTAVITAAAADGSGAAATFTVTVSDTPDVWAKNEVAALAARGVVPPALTSGYRAGITRAEFTALIANVYEYVKGPYTVRGAAPFSDIGGSGYALQIIKGYELGIIDGTGGDTFTPDGTLTREQCAKIISAAVGAISGQPVTSTAALPYGDVKSIDGWALGYVQYAYENGLMTGAGGNFEPLIVLTREQAMLIAERMIEKYGW